jgi:HTH-type transcriptional regulator/antitoxin HigA
VEGSVAVKTAKNATREPADSYFRLVKAFPLLHLRDHAHLAEAQAVIDRLLRRHLDEGEKAYLDVLTDLVEAYEDKHVKIPGASEADVLRELMNANRLSQPALARAVGISQSTISAILNGSRSLTKAQVAAIASYFKISPAVFFPVELV